MHCFWVGQQKKKIPIYDQYFQSNQSSDMPDCWFDFDEGNWNNIHMSIGSTAQEMEVIGREGEWKWKRGRWLSPSNRGVGWWSN